MATIEMYEDFLDWCFNHANILEAKDEEDKRSLLHFALMKGYAPISTKLLTKGTKVAVVFRIPADSFPECVS